MSALKLVRPTDDAALRTEAEARRLVILSVAVLAILFGGLGIWSVLAQLNGAVVAPGVMKVEANVKLVQHAEGGIVRQIFVKEGENVKAGDPIMELEDVDAGASMSTLRDQLDAELAKQARLTAEIRNAKAIDFPEELASRKGEATVAALMRNESELFRAHVAMLSAQAAGLRDQKSAIEAQIESLARQIAAADKSLDYLKQQENMAATLHAQNYVSNARLLDARRSIAEKEEKRFEFESLRAGARQRLADTEMRLQNVRAVQLAESSKELVETQAKILALRERLKPARDALERRIVRAPASGKINVLRAHTVGGVVAARDPIAEIVPEQSQLVAEVRINPADIEEVHPGQEVEVELSGLNRRVTPLLRGKLAFVSPDLNTDPATPTARFFIARAGIAEAPPADVHIAPGMPVAAYIKTRERSPLELWLDPLIGAIRKSLRET
ncbi:MAG: HlyD family type I secretion periplasmic adaptor subunit [Rhodospirillaceae bacterium]